MVEVLKQGLIGLAKVHYVLAYNHGVLILYQDAGYKLGDGIHVLFVQAKAGYFDRADTQSVGIILQEEWSSLFASP